MSYKDETPVIEISGTSRSGKGTLTKILKDMYPGSIAIVEAGKKYREIAWYLLNRDLIRDDFTDIEIEDVLTKLEIFGNDDFLDITKQLLQNDDLYTPVVATTATRIAEHSLTIKYIESLLVRELSTKGISGDYDLIIMDGRKTQEVISKSENVYMLLRLFLTCSVKTAALRECKRLKLNPNSEEGIEIRKTVSLIESIDRNRKNNPIKKDNNSIVLDLNKNNFYDLNNTDCQFIIDTTNMSIEDMKILASMIISFSKNL